MLREHEVESSNLSAPTTVFKEKGPIVDRAFSVDKIVTEFNHLVPGLRPGIHSDPEQLEGVDDTGCRYVSFGNETDAGNNASGGRVQDHRWIPHTDPRSDTGFR